MDKTKVKISVIDFLPEFRKHPIGEKDVKGNDIHYGDTVLKNGDKHLIGYRYGQPVLKQPGTIHHVFIKDYSAVEVLNEMTAAQEYLIIGYDDEPFIQEIEKLNLIHS